MSILKEKRSFFDTEKSGIGKIDNVKSSPERQVKALPFFATDTACLCGFAVQMSAGEEPVLSEAKRNRMDVDLIFVNGNIYTVNERQPHAEAVAVKNERIAFVGSNDRQAMNAAPSPRPTATARSVTVPSRIPSIQPMRDTVSDDKPVTIDHPAAIITPTGRVTLQKGMRLPLTRVKRDSVIVHYFDGRDYEIPRSATDRK